MAGGELVAMRRESRKLQILEIIRTHENPSRTTIKRESKLSMETVLLLVDELITQGLIQDSGKIDSNKAGRKATLLQISGNGAYFVGVYFNAGYMEGVVMNFAWQQVLGHRVQLREGIRAEEMIHILYDVVGHMLHELGPEAALVKGIGIGSPGVTDSEQGIVLRYVHVPDWHNIPLARLVEEYFTIPCFVEHSVKCSVRAKMVQPLFSDERNMVYIQMGRGIFACTITDGHMINGAHFMAGEIGHITVVEDGELCECGHRGCLETVASDAAINRELRRGLRQGRFIDLRKVMDESHQVSVPLLAQAANRFGGECAEMATLVGNTLGRALSGVVATANPAQIIISGRLTKSLDFCKAVEESVHDHCLSYASQNLVFSFSTPNPQQRALGAAHLAYDHFFAVSQNSLLTC